MIKAKSYRNRVTFKPEEEVKIKNEVLDEGEFLKPNKLVRPTTRVSLSKPCPKRNTRFSVFSAQI